MGEIFKYTKGPGGPGSTRKYGSHSPGDRHQESSTPLIALNQGKAKQESEAQ